MNLSPVSLRATSPVAALLAAALLLVPLMPASVVAATLSVNEATFPGAGGDYNNLLSPPRGPGLEEIFRPGAGTNTFVGSISSLGDQGDTWLLRLDPGQTLVRTRISFGTNQDIAINQGSLFAFEQSTANPLLFQIDLPGGTRGVLPLEFDSGVLSIGPGLYTATILTGVLASSSNGPVGYRVAFDVAEQVRAIPVPASAGLLAGGALLLAGVARRSVRSRRTASAAR